jgi:hypothetical protein
VQNKIMQIYKDGTKVWRVNGEFHRTDGHAIEWPDGDRLWYLHGKHYKFDEGLDQTTGLTDEQKVMYKLEHG